MTTDILLSVNVLLLVIYGWLTHRHQQWVNRTLREDIERLNQDRSDLHDRIDNIHKHTANAIDCLVQTIKHNERL